MEGHQKFSYFFSLSTVSCRNVELTTLNISFLGGNPSIVRSSSSLNLHYFQSFIFLLLFYTFVAFGVSTFVCFNVFVSFLGLPKGASTINKGFTCERAKFLLLKKTCSILSGTPRHRALRRCVENNKFCGLAFWYAAVWYPMLLRSPR